MSALRLVRVALLTAALMAPSVAEGRALVGDRAPWFKLESLLGKSVTLRHFRGRPLVLVVGRTQRAAPPCKKWILALLEKNGSQLPIYQVIVVDKAWYIPRGAVISRIKGFSPRRWLHRVLVEWYTVFADGWGVKKHDDPVVFVVDRQGVVRWRRRGAMTPRALAEVQAKLRSLR